MRCGISINDYWNLTLAEMTMYVELYNEQQKQEAYRNASNIYYSALLTAMFVNNTLQGKECPPFEKVFPNIETEETKKAREKREIEIYREQFKAFADSHNKRRS